MGLWGQNTFHAGKMLRVAKPILLKGGLDRQVLIR